MEPVKQRCSESPTDEKQIPLLSQKQASKQRGFSFIIVHKREWSPSRFSLSVEK